MKPSSTLDASFGRVSLRMASSLALSGVLDEITRGLVSDLGASMARVWLARGPDDARYLELVASAGLSERIDGSHKHVPFGELKIGEIARTRTPVCSRDLTGDRRFVDKEWIRTHGLSSFAGYPLIFGDDVLGVLAMFATKKLEPIEFEHLGVFAAQASVAIKNAELFDEVTELSRRLEAENSYLKEELRDVRSVGIVGRSAAITRAFSELERVAKTSTTVLVHGETGTGKELFARALHEMSPRRQRALVKVNCAAIAPTLVESELFGHEKGAFTGATQRRIGRFELADGGTLFLDEIGELPLESQAKLLRVLQEQEFERVGGASSIRVDTRVVAATNRDLDAEVKAGRFRADLFFRLNVFPIHVPPLRARREDVPSLVTAFLESLAQRLGARPLVVDDDVVPYLQIYDWPGNVRELHNVLERGAILARDGRIRVTDLPELRNTGEEGASSTSHDASEAKAPVDAASHTLKENVDAFERSLIVEALRKANGNQSEAARMLRTNRATLQYKMKIHGLQ